ncbi:MAG: ATP-binding protein [Bryobacteraceae bacterium]
MKIWKAAKRFQRTFQVHSKVYAISLGAGILRVNGDKFEPVPGGDRFANGGVYGMLPLGNDGLLVALREGLQKLNGSGAVQRFATEADDQLKKFPLYFCLPAGGGRIALGTEGGGAVILNSEGRLERLIDERSGMENRSPHAAYSDAQGGLWLALDYGIARVESLNPMTYFDERSGIKGEVLSIQRHGDQLYAGTMLGTFRMKPGPSGETATFDRVEGINGIAIVLLSTPTGLLVGGKDGVYSVDGVKATLVMPGDMVNDLFISRRDPKVIYAASQRGAARLQWSGGKWTVGKEFRGNGQEFRSAAEDPDGRVWLTTKFDVWRVDWSKDPPVEERFDTNQGVPQGWKNAYLIAGRVLIASEKGVLHFDEQSKKFVPDSTFGGMFADGTRAVSLIRSDARNNIWISGSGYNGMLHRLGDGSYAWDPLPLRRANLQELYGLLVDDTGVVWASGMDGGLFRREPRSAEERNFSVLLRRVIIADDGALAFGGTGALQSALTLPYEQRALRFEFAAPFFEDSARNQYQVRLEGLDRNWSPWTSETRKDYTNLPEGSYTFRARARNLYGEMGREAAFDFRVLAPWYRTWWAYGLGLLSGAGAIWGLLRWRLQHLAAKNIELQALVDKRTEEIRQKAEALHQANDELLEVNQRLNSMNEEKNEFLGIAAHDLKNPLGGIRGYAEMLREDAADLSEGEIIEFAQKIEKGANLMFNLVSNLLDINKIETGQMTLELKPCSLWETAKHSVEEYQKRANDKDVKLRFMTTERTRDVMADPGPLVEVVDNIVSNAVKYSPHGKNVYVSVYEENGKLRCAVKDEGPGISAEDRKRLFQKFARLSAKPTAGEHSTGLGLAIVKRMVEGMHGDVWCESEPGQGATFIVELPAAAGV